MKNPCSMCKRIDFRLKQLDNDFYCSDCLDNYRCLKCNSLYDGCAFCCKNVCECVNIKLNMIMLVMLLCVYHVLKSKTVKHNYINTLKKNIMNL